MNRSDSNCRSPVGSDERRKRLTELFVLAATDPKAKDAVTKAFEISIRSWVRSTVTRYEVTVRQDKEDIACRAAIAIERAVRSFNPIKPDSNPAGYVKVCIERELAKAAVKTRLMRDHESQPPLDPKTGVEIEPADTKDQFLASTNAM